MKRPGTIESGPLPIGGTTGRMVGPDAAFRKIHNMYPTESGGYVSIDGPMPYLTNSGVTPGEDLTGFVVPVSPVVYGPVRGVFHCLLHDGQRDVLLVHVGSGLSGATEYIWELQGFRQGYFAIVSPFGTVNGATSLRMGISPSGPSDFPTQWVRTPTGVVIIPSGGRPAFYDGRVIANLGYDSAPPPPEGMGPDNSGKKFNPLNPNDHTEIVTGINDTGYAVDGLYSQAASGMPTVFRYGRVGTVQSFSSLTVVDENDDSQAGGYLLAGRYLGKTQWIDVFGNLSPLSPPSNDIRIHKQPSMMQRLDTGPHPADDEENDIYKHTVAPGSAQEWRWTHLDATLKQIAWTGVAKGPLGTIGRMIYRTRDLRNSGDTKFYALPRDASTHPHAFATMPDNVCETYPDNIPDAWLFAEAEDIIPVPPFRIADLAFGRLMAANSDADPGAIWPSMVGRWGTFVGRLKMYPDPEGAAVTGVRRVSGGMLAFSENGTYLVTPNDSGEAFRSSTVSQTIGCVAPSSIRTTRDGTTIWLGRDGFYGRTEDGKISFLFGEHMEEALRFARSRIQKAVAEFDPWSGEYRCWVPYESNLYNNMCFCYNGRYWTTRDDVQAAGVTVTQDHRRLMVVGGRSLVGEDYTNGVWVLDRAGDPLVGRIETGWMRSTRSEERSSIRTVWLWLRETCVTTTDADEITIEARRDYREDTVSEASVNTFPEATKATGDHTLVQPHAWDQQNLEDAVFRRRRPFWVTANIEIPSCEVFKLIIHSTSRFEILAVKYEDQGRQSSGSENYR